MKQKITALLQQLNHGLVEREAHLKLTLLTVLSGENIVLVGPPGTGKSMIARRVAECIEHSENGPAYFEYLLTKFSTPEEIFGPLSIKELKADRFQRNTAGYLPSVKVAFLDEIFKASSSILNALLTILNERIYHNGAIAENVPLRALIAASNELPNEQEELAALYDRFLIRSFVEYVRPENLSRLFEPSSDTPEFNRLNGIELTEIEQRAKSITLPAEIIDAIQRIWQQHKEFFKEDRRESLSDRRLTKLIKLLRVSAATNDRREVDLSDVLLLKDCLWNHPDNAESVRNLILNTLKNYSRPVQLIPETPTAEVIYEVAEDGQTLIPATTRQSLLPADTSATLPAIATKTPGNIIKGFRGSGTKDDPLLIETEVELADLSRPEVGKQGYYFQQIADIDCSSIRTWPKIDFMGNYDGGGHAISKQAEIKIIPNHIDENDCLFTSINESNIANIKLNNQILTKTLKTSHISFCTSNTFISQNIHSCSIIGCSAEILGHVAYLSTIEQCHVSASLISDTAENCKIKDCILTIKENVNFHPLNSMFFGYHTMVNKIQSCELINCFMSSTEIDCHSSKLVSESENISSIKSCAIGSIPSSHEFKISPTNKKTLFSNNILIDSHTPIRNNPNGSDGQSVSAHLFKQRYFEINLGWDFENIWHWDQKSNEPRLRTVGAGNVPKQEKPLSSPATNISSADLLTQQVKANIWL